MSLASYQLLHPAILNVADANANNEEEYNAGRVFVEPFFEKNFEIPIVAF